jgi:hypothetical protein
VGVGWSETEIHKLALREIKQMRSKLNPIVIHNEWIRQTVRVKMNELFAYRHKQENLTVKMYELFADRHEQENLTV